MATKQLPIFRSAFQGPDDEFSGLGKRPVVFDILAPDYETSILPSNLRMVLHVNPSTMSFQYQKVIERIQTRGGFVEQHWGDGSGAISFSMATGGFMRLFTGLSSTTGGGLDTGGNRRETIAYDKYLDMLALFHNNGSVYDTAGKIVFQGIIKIIFDGGIYYGWFSSFNVEESADKPYMFNMTAEFTISHEIQRVRTSFSSIFSEKAASSVPKDTPLASAPIQNDLPVFTDDTPPTAPTFASATSSGATDTAAGSTPTSGTPTRSGFAANPAVPIATGNPDKTRVETPSQELVLEGSAEGILDPIDRPAAAVPPIVPATGGWGEPELIADAEGILDELTR